MIRGIIVMGVAGAGKSTVGTALAEHLGWSFRDADDFHPPANVAKMKAGTPLTDADRAPWLAAIRAHLEREIAAGRPAIVTCSALKRAYREVLAGGRSDLRIVHLSGERDLVGARMAARAGHFMPTALLDSQFATLEPPATQEGVLVVDVTPSPSAIVASIVDALALSRAPTPRAR